MKSQIKNMLVATALIAGVALGADHKHPSDPCPKGTHEVVRENRSGNQTGGKVSGGANGLVARGGAEADHRRGTSTTERSKVCRDNKDGKVKEGK